MPPNWRGIIRGQAPGHLGVGMKIFWRRSAEGLAVANAAGRSSNLQESLRPWRLEPAKPAGIKHANQYITQYKLQFYQNCIGDYESPAKFVVLCSGFRNSYIEPAICQVGLNGYRGFRGILYIESAPVLPQNRKEGGWRRGFFAVLARNDEKEIYNGQMSESAQTLH